MTMYETSLSTHSSRHCRLPGQRCSGDNDGAILALQVCVSRVKWVMPLGLTGVTPLAAIGPVSVGPSHSGAERSSVEAPHVTVFVDALQSLLQRKAVLRLLLTRPQARSNLKPVAWRIRCAASCAAWPEYTQSEPHNMAGGSHFG